MQKEVLDDLRLVVTLLSKGLVTDPSVGRLSPTDFNQFHNAIENLVQYSGADADVVAEILSGLKHADLPKPLKERLDIAPVAAEAIKILADQGVTGRLDSGKSFSTHKFTLNEGERFTLDNRTMSRVTFEVRKGTGGQMDVAIWILPVAEEAESANSH